MDSFFQTITNSLCFIFDTSMLWLFIKFYAISFCLQYSSGVSLSRFRRDDRFSWHVNCGADASWQFFFKKRRNGDSWQDSQVKTVNIGVLSEKLRPVRKKVPPREFWSYYYLRWNIVWHKVYLISFQKLVKVKKSLSFVAVIFFTSLKKMSIKNELNGKGFQENKLRQKSFQH